MSDIGSNTVEIVIGEGPGSRLDKALARFAPEGKGLSRSALQRLIEGGAVSLAGAAVRDVKARPAEGDVFAVVLPEPVDVVAEAEELPLDVVFEDDHLIVVNKPAGMVVHPAPGSERGTLVNALLHHCADSLSGIGGEKRPGIVHRIDKDTSGLIVAAKSDVAHQGLAAQFADHSIMREYRAICHGVPSRGDPRIAGLRGVAFEDGNVIRISGNLARHKTDRKKQAVVVNAGRHAITRFRVEEAFAAGAALITCWLETGRTHQIRVHLAFVGHALVGDPTYGGRRKLATSGMPAAARVVAEGFDRQALHAATLGFVHPVSGAEMRFAAEMPDDMLGLLAALKNPSRENL